MEIKDRGAKFIVFIWLRLEFGFGGGHKLHVLNLFFCWSVFSLDMLLLIWQKVQWDRA